MGLPVEAGPFCVKGLLCAGSCAVLFFQIGYLLTDETDIAPENSSITGYRNPLFFRYPVYCTLTLPDLFYGYKNYALARLKGHGTLLRFPLIL
jgi:hypothetical protein